MQVSSRLTWWTCLWPGLPRVWWCGDWRALLLAVAFGLAVNLWLVARFLWPELLDRSLVTVVGLATAGFWLVSVWYGFRTLGELRGPADAVRTGGLVSSGSTRILE